MLHNAGKFTKGGFAVKLRSCADVGSHLVGRAFDHAVLSGPDAVARMRIATCC